MNIMPVLPRGFTVLHRGSVVMVIRDRDNTVVSVMTPEKSFAIQIAEDTCRLHRSYLCERCFPVNS